MQTSDSELIRVPKPGQLFLWTVLLDGLNEATILGELFRVLSVDEQKEARRFRQTVDRDQFIVARSLLRLALSHHFLFPLNAWRFERDEHGKPFLVAPALPHSVQFSVAHTRGLVACLITLASHAGLDVEKIIDDYDYPAMTGSMLSPFELRDLNTLTGNEKIERFFVYWTLKEALTKALGFGMSLKLDDITMQLRPGEKIRAQFPLTVDNDPSAWVFWRERLPSGHAIAVATKRGFDTECILIQRTATIDLTGGLNLRFTDRKLGCGA